MTAGIKFTLVLVALAASALMLIDTDGQGQPDRVDNTISSGDNLGAVEVAPDESAPEVVRASVRPDDPIGAREASAVASNPSSVADVVSWLNSHNIGVMPDRPSADGVAAVHESVRQTVDGLRRRIKGAEASGNQAGVELLRVSELKQSLVLDALHQGCFVVVPAGYGEVALRGLSDAVRGTWFYVFASAKTENGKDGQILVVLRPSSALGEAEKRAWHARRVQDEQKPR